MKKQTEKESIHLGGGFWAHIEWDGETGTDQQGRQWYNRKKPHCESFPSIKDFCSIIGELIQLTTKAKLI